jgi:KDO2-lipid IV(A) lauroyltransferase
MSALLRLLTALLALIPLPLLHGLGAVLGSLFALLPNRHRRITLQNLALCFPELSERERARLLILSLRETARTVLETALVWRGSRQRLLGLVREVRGSSSASTCRRVTRSPACTNRRRVRQWTA